MKMVIRILSYNNFFLTFLSPATRQTKLHCQPNCQNENLKGNIMTSKTIALAALLLAAPLVSGAQAAETATTAAQPLATAEVAVPVKKPAKPGIFLFAPANDSTVTFKPVDGKYEGPTGPFTIPGVM
jgi:hypothetical protein